MRVNHSPTTVLLVRDELDARDIDGFSGAISTEDTIRVTTGKGCRVGRLTGNKPVVAVVSKRLGVVSVEILCRSEVRYCDDWSGGATQQPSSEPPNAQKFLDTLYYNVLAG
jgi:hypothetical protein